LCDKGIYISIIVDKLIETKTVLYRVDNSLYFIFNRQLTKIDFIEIQLNKLLIAFERQIIGSIGLTEISKANLPSHINSSLISDIESLLPQIDIPSISSYSIANPDILINLDHWIVSVMQSYNNQDNTFLIIEGITQFGKGTIKRYDLVKDSKKPGYAVIVDKIIDALDIHDMKEKFCQDFLNQETVYCKTWSITRAQAAALHQDIMQDKSKSIRYLTSQCKNNEGQNHFTWVCEKLHNLNDKRIQLPEKWIKSIAVETNFCITASENQEQKFCLIS
jgi:hypothetical protein